MVGSFFFIFFFFEPREHLPSSLWRPVNLGLEDLILFFRLPPTPTPTPHHIASLSHLAGTDYFLLTSTLSLFRLISPTFALSGITSNVRGSCVRFPRAFLDVHRFLFVPFHRARFQIRIEVVRASFDSYLLRGSRYFISFAADW